MGLFKRLLGDKAPPSREPGDESLLILSLLIMAGSDDILEAKEAIVMESFFNTMPEFRNKNFEQLVTDTNKVLVQYNGRRLEAVAELAKIQNDAIKVKCFVLATDLALCSGDVDEQEEILEAMQKTLEISDEDATKILEVLSLKYA